MGAYTVKAVGEAPREWSSTHGGRFLSYTVDLENEDGVTEIGVEWNRKQESSPPREGDRIAGHIEPGKFGERFKMDYEATKELSSGGGGSSDYSGGGGERKSGGSSWKPEAQFDPEKVARITRAHSQGMAVELLVAVPGFNEAPKPNKQQAITAWADFFDGDVQKAAAVAATKQALDATEAPAIRPAAADGEDTHPDDDIPF